MTTSEELVTEEDGLKTHVERKKRQATNLAIRRRNKNLVSRRYDREKRCCCSRVGVSGLYELLCQSGDIKLLKNALICGTRRI